MGNGECLVHRSRQRSTRRTAALLELAIGQASSCRLRTADLGLHRDELGDELL
jgi:hypothetical protein